MAIGQDLKCKFKTGDVVVGKVLKINASSVVVRFPTKDGHGVVLLRKAGKHYDSLDVTLD